MILSLFVHNIYFLWHGIKNINTFAELESVHDLQWQIQEEVYIPSFNQLSFGINRKSNLSHLGRIICKMDKYINK